MAAEGSKKVASSTASVVVSELRQQALLQLAGDLQLLLQALLLRLGGDQLLEASRHLVVRAL